MKKIWLIILSVCIFIISLGNVRAESISYQYLPNIYYNLTVDGKTTSKRVTAFYLGNRLAYCIEPGKEINTPTYDTYKDWSKTNLKKETLDYIEKLGYYGYEYPNHQTDKYYIATQELIWKAVAPVNIKWTTGQNNTGSTINVEKEKQEIINLVDAHNIKPSFIDEKIIGKIKETKEIQDINGVLNNYEIISKSNHNLKIEDNRLKITFSEEETGLEEIILKRKTYDMKTLLVYVKPGSQQLASLRLSNKEEVKFYIENQKESEEIVRVPSTADNDINKHFNILWTINNDIKKFN